jgi:hypothetical protein
MTDGRMSGVFSTTQIIPQEGFMVGAIFIRSSIVMKNAQ